MTRALAIVVAGLLAFAVTVEGYVKLGGRAGNRVVGITWGSRTISYAVTNRSVAGVSAADFQAAAARAFATWAGVSNVDLNIQFLGFTNAEPLVADGISVLGFQSHPEFEDTLGAAVHELDDVTGTLLEADIFFNTEFDWSVAANGQAGRFDVESIAAHEIGHFLGLGHSALGETELRSGGRTIRGKGAIMFPIAFAPGNIADRALKPDDIAGITDLYGNSDANRLTGAISGRVRLNNRGVLGAHVTAFNTTTGALVGGYSLNSAGDFVIAGLTPGMYVVRVEPLDDVDLDSVFSDPEIDTDFRVTYHPRLVAVPAGGTSGNIVVEVQR
jgi:hypothetical protein